MIDELAKDLVPHLRIELHHELKQLGRRTDSTEKCCQSLIRLLAAGGRIIRIVDNPSAFKEIVNPSLLFL